MNILWLWGLSFQHMNFWGTQSNYGYRKLWVHADRYKWNWSSDKKWAMDMRSKYPSIKHLPITEGKSNFPGEQATHAILTNWPRWVDIRKRTGESWPLRRRQDEENTQSSQIHVCSWCRISTEWWENSQGSWIEGYSTKWLAWAFQKCPRSWEQRVDRGAIPDWTSLMPSDN